MSADEREAIDRLDAYLDALAMGGPIPDAAAAPQWQAIDRQLRSLDRTPLPSPAFAARLLEELMPTHAFPSARGVPALPHANGRVRPPVGSVPPTLSPAARRWVPTHLATAALVLLIVVGGFFAFGPSRLGQPQLAPAFLPAIQATPATAESDGVATKPLLDLVIPTISDDKVFVVVERYTMPPATTLEADMHGGRVPTVFFVVDGTVEARVNDAPQPARVIRSGGTEAEAATASGESVTLTAGDGFVLPENGAADLMNLASEPAIVLLPLLPTNVDFPSGDATIVWKGYGGNVWNASAPVALALKQVTLAPGAEIPGADAPNVKQIVALVDADRMMDARTTSTGALRNAGDQPLEAYVLTVTSAAALNPASNGTPTTQGGATPAP